MHYLKTFETFTPRKVKSRDETVVGKKLKQDKLAKQQKLKDIRSKFEFRKGVPVKAIELAEKLPANLDRMDEYCWELSYIPIEDSDHCLSIIFNIDPDEPIGFQIVDEEGHDVYYGLDVDEAYEAIIERIDRYKDEGYFDDIEEDDMSENVFVPKKIAARESARKELYKKKISKLQAYLNVNIKIVEKKLQKFKYSVIDSEDLEHVVDILDNDNLLEAMVDYLGDDVEDLTNGKMTKEEIDNFFSIYIMCIKLKDLVKCGDFFDWKENDACIKYVNKNLKKPWLYAYNGYPGGDGTLVIFSKLRLENCEDAIDEEDID